MTRKEKYDSDKKVLADINFRNQVTQKPSQVSPRARFIAAEKIKCEM